MHGEWLAALPEPKLQAQSSHLSCQLATVLKTVTSTSHGSQFVSGPAEPGNAAGYREHRHRWLPPERGEPAGRGEQIEEVGRAACAGMPNSFPHNSSLLRILIGFPS